MGALEGKVVIVTGGGRGIGRAIAQGAAAQGARVVVADIGASLLGGPSDEPVAHEVAGVIRSDGGEAVALCESVATAAGARSIVDAALSTWGRLDGAVCAAGILRHRPFLELTEDDFDAVIATHLKGHFLVFQNALKAMVAQGSGGSLIGIGSGHAIGDPNRTPYRAAKAGVLALTRSVAMAGAEHRVRANVISPIAATRMTKASALPIAAPPEDIAPMAVFLLSDRSANITGEMFAVTGTRIGVYDDAFERHAAAHHERWGQDDIAAIMPWLLSGRVSGPPPAPPLPPSFPLAQEGGDAPLSGPRA